MVQDTLTPERKAQLDAMAAKLIPPERRAQLDAMAAKLKPQATSTNEYKDYPPDTSEDPFAPGFTMPEELQGTREAPVLKPLRKKEAGLLDTAKEFVKGASRGLGEGAALLGDVAVDTLTGEPTPEALKMRQQVRELYANTSADAPDPNLQPGIGSQLGEFTGGAAAYAAAATAGPAGPIALAAVQGGAAAHYRSIVEGATPEVTWLNTLAQAGISAGMMAAFSPAARLSKILAGAGQPMRQALGSAAVDAASGAGLMTAQGVLSETLSQHLLRKPEDRDELGKIVQDAWEQGGLPALWFGVGVGALQIAMSREATEQVKAQGKTGEAKPAGQNAPDGINQAPDLSAAEPTPSPELTAALQEQQIAQEPAISPQAAEAPVAESEAQAQPGERVASLAEPPQSAAAAPQGEPGGASPTGSTAPLADAAAPPPPGKATGIKNATAEAELIAMGAEPPEGRIPRKDIDIYKAQKEKFDADPNAEPALVAELERTNRQPTDDEAMLLALGAAKRKQAVENAQRKAIADPTEANRAEAERVSKEYQDAAQAWKLVGAEQGAAFRMRRAMIAEDFSYAAMERKAQIAKGREPLTSTERAEILAETDALKASNSAKDARIAQLEEERVQTAAKEQVALAKKRVASQPRAPRAEKIAKTRADIDALFKELASFSSQANVGLDTRAVTTIFKLAAKHIELGVREFSAWADEMVKRAGESVRPHLQAAWDAANREQLVGKMAARVKEGAQLKDLGRYTQKIVEHFVREGVTEVGPLHAKVHDVLRSVFPEITPREAMAAIGHYGEFKRLSKDEVSVKRRDLAGQARELSKLADLTNRIPPKVTGVEYQEPTPAQKRLSTKVKDWMDKLGIKVVADPAAQIKSTLDSMKTRVRNSMADMQHAIDIGEKIVGKERVPLSDAELVALKAQHAELKAQYETLFKGELDAQKIASATKAVEKSIADYEKRIAAGDIARKQGTPGPTSPELETLKARRDALREELQSLRDIANPGKTPEQRAHQARKTRQKNELARLQERTFYGEFGTDVSPAPKRKALEMDAEELKSATDIEQRRLNLARIVERHRLANRTPMEVALDLAKEAYDTPANIRTSIDASYVGRQGIFLAIDPMNWKATATEHIPKMLRGMMNERKALEYETAIRSHEMFPFAEASGFKMLGAGNVVIENMHKSLATRIPIVGRLFKASDRAFSTFANVQRFDAFLKDVRAIEGTPTTAQGKELMRVIDNFSGRGTPGRLAPALDVAGRILWSPRLLLSRVQTLGEPVTQLGKSIHGTADPVTRKIIAKRYARTLIGMTAMYTLARLFYEEEGDPRSSDFGKLKHGSQRLDPGAGMNQVLTVTARTLTGESVDQNGRVRNLKGDQMSDVWKRFVRSKLAPIPAAAWTVLTHENYNSKEPVTPQGVAADLVVPMSGQNLLDAMHAEGVSYKVAHGILAFFGIGLQDYDR